MFNNDGLEVGYIMPEINLLSVSAQVISGPECECV